MTRVILAPINFDTYELLNEIISDLNEISKFEFEISPLNIDIKEAYSAERGQYNSTQILRIMIENIKEESCKVVGIVKYDLFIPVLTYVFGEAQLDGRFSIISIFRLHEEFYSGKSDNNLLKQRTIKEILHELGHTFGLIHCKDWDCVMHSSSSIEEVDIKGKNYCFNCRQKIEEKLRYY